MRRLIIIFLAYTVTRVHLPPKKERVSSMPIRYPEVERIDLLPISNSSNIDYLVVGKTFFDARQQRGVENALQEVLGANAVVFLRSQRGKLVVSATPRDSLKDNGSFRVLAALKELLNPTAPFVAVGYVIDAPVRLLGTYILGVRLLTAPSEQQLQLLAAQLAKLQSVQEVQPAPLSTLNLHFILTIRGEVSTFASSIMLELRALGIAITATPYK